MACHCAAVSVGTPLGGAGGDVGGGAVGGVDGGGFGRCGGAGGGFVRRRGEGCEHILEHGVDAAQVVQGGGGECVGAAEAEEDGEAGEGFRCGGEAVRLAVGDHLQAVFGAAQKRVGIRECKAGFGGEVTERGFGAQRGQGGGHAQGGGAAAPDQLQGLGAELHFADAAFAQFQIMAQQLRGRRQGGGEAGAFMRIHAVFHGADVRYGGEIEVAAPDEGADFIEEAAAEGEVTSDGAGLDEGGAFPGLAEALVIGEGRRQADAGGGAGGVWTQAQIDAEDVATRVARLHKRHQIARHAGENLTRAGCAGVAVRAGGFARFGIGVDGWVVEKDQVDIAGIIQLARAEFAHGEHHEAAAPFGGGGMRQAQFTRGMGLAQQMGGGDAQGAVGEIRQRAGDLAEAPLVADVGDRDGQRDAAFGGAQAGGDLRAWQRGGEALQGAERLVAHRIGAAAAAMAASVSGSRKARSDR